jgi:hypothetical protein
MEGKQMKEFSTALKAVTEDPEAPLEFKIDGQTVSAYRPTDGQIAVLMASLGRHTAESTKVAGVIDFFVATLDDESYNYVVNRLLSRDDPLDLEPIQEVIEWLIEEWSGRPTPKPSGSTRSQRTGGQRSKPRTTKSTSSNSEAASS